MLGPLEMSLQPLHLQAVTLIFNRKRRPFLERNYSVKPSEEILLSKAEISFDFISRLIQRPRHEEYSRILKARTPEYSLKIEHLDTSRH